VYENLDITARIYGLSCEVRKKRIQELLNFFKISELYSRSTGMLSAGQITRVMLIKAFIIYLFHDVSMIHMISTFFLLFPPLFIAGLWIGFTCLQIVVLFGRRATELAFVIGWFLLPLSGAYYPIDVLPLWAQKISTYLPRSHVFQGMRNYVMYQHDPTTHLIKGYSMGIVYAAIALFGFIYCFNRSKNKGLARLVD